MASLLRPAMLKQTILSSSARRISPSIAVAPSASRSALIRPSSTWIQRRQTPLAKPQTTSIASRIAPFHSSAQRNILPPGPQVIKGGVNDPAPVPSPHPTEGSYHWVFERLLSVGLIPLTVAPFAAGSLNPTMDALLCASILIHSHIGFESIVVDYLPTWQVPTARKIGNWLLRLATVVVGVGFYEFETNDVGLTEAIKRVWTA